MKRILSLLLLVLGCHTQPAPPAYPGQQNYTKWEEPTFQVFIQPGAPPCLFPTVTEALSLLHPRVPVELKTLEASTARGRVLLVWATPQEVQLDDTAVGLTQVSYDPKAGNVWWAVTFAKECSVRLWAHELGHSLGLKDVVAPGRLMHYLWREGGYEIAPDERATLDSTGFQD